MGLRANDAPAVLLWISLATACAGGDGESNSGIPGFGGGDGSTTETTASGSDDGTTAQSGTSTADTTATGAAQSTSNATNDSITATGPAPGTSTGLETTGPGDDCVIVFEEDFSGAGLDGSPDWETQASGGATAAVVAGTLQVSADNTDGGGGFYIGEATLDLPERGAVAFELVQGPDPGIVWLGIVDGEREVHIDVLDGVLRATYRNPGDSGYTPLSSAPYNPAQHRFLRLSIDAIAPAVRAETSADGRAWTVFDQHDVSLFDLGSARLSIGLGLLDPIVLSPIATIDNIVICES